MGQHLGGLVYGCDHMTERNQAMRDAARPAAELEDVAAAPDSPVDHLRLISGRETSIDLDRAAVGRNRSGIGMHHKSVRGHLPDQTHPWVEVAARSDRARRLTRAPPTCQLPIQLWTKSDPLLAFLDEAPIDFHLLEPATSVASGLAEDHLVVVEAVAVDLDATLSILVQSSPVTIDSTASVKRSWACLRASVDLGIACLLRSAAFKPHERWLRDGVKGEIPQGRERERVPLTRKRAALPFTTSRP